MVRITSVDDQSFQEIPGGLQAVFLERAEEIQLGIARAAPGNGERWHRHNNDVEEIYYTLSGRGRITWQEGDYRCDAIVERGDAVVLEKGGLEHEILSVGEDPWEFVFAINNPPGDTYSDIFERYELDDC